MTPYALRVKYDLESYKDNNWSRSTKATQVIETIEDFLTEDDHVIKNIIQENLNILQNARSSMGGGAVAPDLQRVLSELVTSGPEDDSTLAIRASAGGGGGGGEIITAVGGSGTREFATVLRDVVSKPGHIGHVRTTESTRDGEYSREMEFTFGETEEVEKFTRLRDQARGRAIGDSRGREKDRGLPFLSLE